jgi:hypothetical protein
MVAKHLVMKIIDHLKGILLSNITEVITEITADFQTNVKII